MTPRAIPSRRQAMATCIFTALSVAACAGLFTAATLAPAPLAVVPLLIAVCIGFPLMTAWSLPLAIAVLRTRTPQAAGRKALAAMRNHLAQLPETEHPLGL